MEVFVANVSEFGPNNILAATAEGINIVLVKSEDGSINALENRCSHDNFALSDGNFEDGALVCPAHGARFDPNDGRPLCLPAVRPVKVFPCRVEEGRIFVRTSED